MPDFDIVGGGKHIFEDFINDFTCTPGPSGRDNAGSFTASIQHPRLFGPRTAVLWAAGACQRPDL